MVAAAETGTAFAPIHRQDLDRVFAIQQERLVGNDNTILFTNHVWQIPSTPFRATLAGCRVIVYEHLNGSFSVGYGPHTVACFTAAGDPIESPRPRSRRTSAARPVSRRLPPSTAPRYALRASRGSVPGGNRLETQKKEQTKNNGRKTSRS